VISHNKLNFQIGSGVGEFYLGNVCLQEVLSKELAETISESLPTDFELFQNYPNPFNPTTIISFALPKEQNVVLKVFDALGKEVICLANGSKEAGVHYISFDASKLSAGIYFYTLQSRDFIKTRKMVLIK